MDLFFSGTKFIRKMTSAVIADGNPERSIAIDNDNMSALQYVLCQQINRQKALTLRDIITSS